MKIDFSFVIRDLNGEPARDEDNKTEITLASLSCTALLRSYNDEHITVIDKLRRAKLAERIHIGGQQDVTIEEAVELRRLIGHCFPPLAVLRAYDALPEK